MPPSLTSVPSTDAPIGAMTATAAGTVPVEEEWATPATQQDPTPQQPDLPIDPRLRTPEEPFPSTQLSEDSQPQISAYPLDVLEGTSGTRDADAWLDNMFNNDDNEWLPDMADDIPSPMTLGGLGAQRNSGEDLKGCKCAAHQEIYKDWPTHDAELTIAKCMTVCVYCGVDYYRPPTPRLHLKGAKHAPNNISVVRETLGRGSSTTPSWKLKPPAEIASEAQTTQTAPATNSTSELLPSCWHRSVCRHSSAGTRRPP